MTVSPLLSPKQSIEKKEQYRSRKTIWAWAGMLTGVIGNIMLGYGSLFGLLFVFGGVGVAIYACWNWAVYKGRNPAWCLLGILYPIGYLPMALLTDKNPVS